MRVHVYALMLNLMHYYTILYELQTGSTCCDIAYNSIQVTNLDESYVLGGCMILYFFILTLCLVLFICLTDLLVSCETSLYRNDEPKPNHQKEFPSARLKPDVPETDLYSWFSITVYFYFVFFIISFF